MKNLLLLLFTILISLMTNAQTIEGIVYNIDTNEPLFDVNIIEKNSTNGTTTDVNGGFQLQVTSENTTINISHLSFTTLSRKLTAKDFQSTQKFYLHPSAHQLSEVQLRAYNSNEELINVPAAVGVVSAKNLKQASVYGLEDAFNTIAGVRVEAQDASNTRISIRSTGYRAGFGLRNVKVYFDEVPLTEASGFTWLGGIQPAMLQSAEIIKGPGSSLYGSGTAGVVLLNSPKIKNTTVELQSTIGSYNLYNQLVKATVSKGNTGIGLVYNQVNTDGYREHSEDKSRSLLLNGYSQSKNDVNKLSWLLLYKDQDSDLAGPLTLESLANDREAANPAFAANNAGRDQKQLRLGLTYDFSIWDAFRNKTTVFLAAGDFDFVLPPFLMFAENRNYGVRSHFESPEIFEEMPTILRAGLEYQQSELRNVRYANQNGTLGNQILDIKENSRQTNVFFQMDSQLSKKWKLQAGASLNFVNFSTINLLNNATEDNLDFDTNFSPRIALSYFPSSHLAIHGSVSTGFSPPSAQETRLQNGQINTKLEPEIGTNYQLDIKGFALDHKLNYDISVFHYKGNDELVNLTLSDNTTVTRNASETIKSGIELTASYLLYESPNGFLRQAVFNTSSGFYNYEFQDYIIENGDSFDGNRITGAPEQEVNVGLAIKFPYRINLSSQYKYVGDIPLNDGNTVFADSFSTFDLQLRHQFQLAENFTLKSQVLWNNIFDEVYNSFFALNAAAPPQSPAYYYPAYLNNLQVSIGLQYIFK
ncbi:TonB-dependent receptor [uncultured Aquimarina sp.]|uniref:TonB-dependent receptor n=1 Tax=uncultured Aquimarina sp. TaxID=575652 RepID=UPI00260666CA|nr:TonB-dependent receptor [uncultured Aquimarina sp.]